MKVNRCALHDEVRVHSQLGGRALCMSCETTEVPTTQRELNLANEDVAREAAREAWTAYRKRQGRE